MTDKPRPPVPGKLDKGIAKAVNILRENGIETCQSCEGGKGHTYAEPTIEFRGGPDAGWRAMAVCLAHGMPVLELRRFWSMDAVNEPTGPYWAVVFRNRIY